MNDKEGIEPIENGTIAIHWFIAGYQGMAYKYVGTVA